ncbi:MAG: elongation factor 1-beta [Methanoregulaceae archaeon]|jgi:elongation factor 1-beta|nr:elongation factor 1-beta [Methanoregulaceae archaeon]
MGDVALILRVMPESPEVDLEALKSEIKRILPRVQQIVEEPIGFGLKALKLVVVVSDQGGETDAVEGKISGLKGVERAEIVELTLM